MINSTMHIKNYSGFRYLFSLTIAIFLHIIILFFIVCFLINKDSVTFAHNSNEPLFLHLNTDCIIDKDQNNQKRTNYQGDSNPSDDNFEKFKKEKNE